MLPEKGRKTLDDGTEIVVYDADDLVFGFGFGDMNSEYWNKFRFGVQSGDVQHQFEIPRHKLESALLNLAYGAQEHWGLTVNTEDDD